MKDDDDEWGPWIEHDGRGFPVPVGTLVHRVFDAPITLIKGDAVQPVGEIIEPLEAGELESWLWVLPRNHPVGEIARVVRYRTRQSRGMKLLRSLVKDAPQEVFQ